MAEFDFNGARTAGYSNDEILRYLTSPGIQPIPPQTPAPADKLRQMAADAAARNAPRVAMGPPEAPPDRTQQLRDMVGAATARTQPFQLTDGKSWVPPAGERPQQPAPFQPDFKSGPLGMVNPEAGIENIITGAQQMWQPSGTTADDPAFWNPKAEGASKVIRGAGTFGAYGLPAAFAEAPLATLGGLAGGAAASYATSKAAEAAGVPEGQADLMSDLSGLVGGAMGGHAAHITPEQFDHAMNVAKDFWSDTEGSSPRAPRVQNAAGMNVRGSMGGPKGKDYIPDPDDVAALAQSIASTRPFDPEKAARLQKKLSPEDFKARMQVENAEIGRRANNDAYKILQWRNWDRPDLVKTYGDLRRSNPLDSRLERLQNTHDVVQQRIRDSLDYLATPAGAPWRPVDYGIVDRGLIPQAMGGFPDVTQTPFPRKVGTARAELSHIPEIYEDPVNRGMILAQMDRGMGYGGATFYPSLYPLKAEMIAQNTRGFGLSGGDLFDHWVDSVTPGSARNSIYNERAVGNFLRGMTFRGIPLTPANVTAEMALFKDRLGAGGLPLMDVHRVGAQRVLEQGISPEYRLQNSLTEDYKIPTYAMNTRGNFAHSFTGDVHEATGQTLGSRYHPYFKEAGGFSGLEYGPAEQYFLGLAKERSLPGGTAQAARWFGGGDMTGLMSPRGDSLDLYERQAAYTLHLMGKPTDPVSVRRYLLKLASEGGDLAPWASDDQMPEHRMLQPGSQGRIAAPRKK